MGHLAMIYQKPKWLAVSSENATKIYVIEIKMVIIHLGCRGKKGGEKLA
jgi:hypothetical protein